MEVNSRILKPTVLAIAISMSVSGCATMNETVGSNSAEMNCAMGLVAGALAGVAISAMTGGDKNAMLLGAAIGGAAGCAGMYMYKNHVSRLDAIAKEEKMRMQNSMLEASNAKGEPQVVGVQSEAQVGGMFASGSAELTADGRRQLSKLAGAMAANQKDVTAQNAADAKKANKPIPYIESIKILVVGHTDSTGSAAFNQALSEKRAQAVAELMAQAGINPDDVYYQGAGSSRPIATNTTAAGREMNRRVEMTQINSKDLLVERVRSQRNNAKYLEYGTQDTQQQKSSADKPVAVAKPAPNAKPSVKTSTVKAPVAASEVIAAGAVKSEAPVKSAPSTSTLAIGGKGGMDFGGIAVTDTTSALARGFEPKKSMFSLVSSAYASKPIGSCIADMPRTAGEVMNLASGKPLEGVETNDYLPGMDGRPWGQIVNGQLATVGPVSILKDDATLAKQPFMEFASDYKKPNQNRSGKIDASANTYDGESQVLYRVFSNDVNQSPIACMDILFDKRTGSSTAGEIYYPKDGIAYVVNFKPARQ